MLVASPRTRRLHSNDTRTRHRQEGVTLVESAMVIGIISLIILGALLALEAVTEQRRMTQAVQDIALIRSAVSKFAAGGLVVYPGTGTVGTDAAADARTLGGWDDLAGFLPGSLGILAAAVTAGGDTITTGNPWSEDYVLHVGDTEGSTVGGTAKWTLRLEGVPDGLAPVLVKQLDLNGALAATYGGASPAGTCDPHEAGTDSGDITWVCVSYEE